MNAYELANQLALLLMLNGLDEANTNEINQASHMLRQQADRIAELEKLVDELAGYKESYENCHRMCNGYGMN